MNTITRIALTLSLTCAAVWAQTATAQLSGVIRDASGLPVAGAEVQATQTATAAVHTATSGTDGKYALSGLPSGTYTIEVSKPGFEKYVQAGMILPANGAGTFNASLKSATAPSLADLGISPEQVRGSAQDQARLDRRERMLKTHQRLGLITIAPLVATLVSSGGAKARRGTETGRDLHAALGLATAGMYFTTASFAIFAPRISGTTSRGPIRLHKALAWIHGPGMILTPILGAMAFSQINRGERVHGIASAHSTVAWATAVAYGAAMLSVSIKF